MKVKYLLLFFIPLFIILLNLNLLIFNDNFYKFDNKDVNKNLLNYFKDKEDLKFNYTERELIHLHNVKNLVRMLDIIVYALAFFILLILIFNKKDIFDVLMISGAITIAITLILVFFSFDLLFTKFHEALFLNDYWLLDEGTLLIKTYPIEFFTGFFKRLILNIMISSLILIIIGVVKYVYTQHKPGSG